jgi:hypothetical protein
MTKFTIQQFYALPIYAFCTDLREINDYSPTQHQLIFITEIVFTARYEMGFVLSSKGSGIVLNIVQ